MFITESPVIGSYSKKQGSFNIPKYNTQIGGNSYSHITKKAVDYGKDTILPDVKKIANTPFDMFSNAPKESTATKWSKDFFKTKKLLDNREERLENVFGKDTALLYNQRILDDKPYDQTIVDGLKDNIKKEVDRIKSKVKVEDKGKGRQYFRPIKKKDKMDIDTATGSVSRLINDLGTEIKKKAKKDMMDLDPVLGKRKANETFTNIKGKKFKADKSVAGVKRKASNPLTVAKKFKKDTSVAGVKRKAVASSSSVAKKLKKDTSVAGVKRKAPNQIKLGDKKRKLNPASSTAKKRKGDTLENPKKKVQKTKDPKTTRTAPGKTLRRLKKVNYKE